MKIVTGKVVKGRSRGVKLGFPTANIVLDEALPSGVYEAEVLVDNIKYFAAVFIGKDEKILEAHILKFSADLYGKEIEVRLGRKIRDVMVFKSDQELTLQIKKDIQGLC